MIVQNSSVSTVTGNQIQNCTLLGYYAMSSGKYSSGYSAAEG